MVKTVSNNNSYEGCVTEAVELLRLILKSKFGSNLYMDDPVLHDRVIETLEEFEYILSDDR